MSNFSGASFSHYVKVREHGKKSWSFLSQQGVTRLRLHALRFTEDGATGLIAENQADNPEWEFKIVPIPRKDD